ncbi:MAG: hypothetical protein KAI71_04700 [Candidatus Pacebacteria bacterium]|nr:hypothetical protein [Candidatus Paceibacterota bacterium]
MYEIFEKEIINSFKNYTQQSISGYANKVRLMKLIFKTIALLFFITLILLGCAKKETSNDIKKLLSECDKIQNTINTPYVPSCYLEIFKKHNWTSTEVKQYLLEHKNIDIDDRIRNSSEWEDAWGKYYTN